MRTIEIRTTQNVTIEYELAPLRDRFFAYFIDWMIVGAFYVVAAAILALAMNDSLDSGISQQFLSFLLPIGLFITYQLLCEIILNGQSLKEVRVLRWFD